MSKKSHQLEYLIAREKIVDLILNESYAVGDRLPSRGKLAEMLGIGRISIQRAVVMLAEEGILENIRGSGSYVKSRPERPLPDGVGEGKAEVVHDEYLLTLQKDGSRKVLTLGIPAVEMAGYGNLWKKVISDFERDREDVAVTIREFDNHVFPRDDSPLFSTDILLVVDEILPWFVTNGWLFDTSELSDHHLGCEDACYPAFAKASMYNGSCWGMPLVASGTCVFVDSSVAEIYREELAGLDPYAFIEKLARLDTFPKGPYESMIASNHSIVDWFFLVHGKSVDGFDIPAILASPEFSEFVQWFDRFWREPGMFLPNIQFGTLDSANALIEKRVPIAFGNTCWNLHFANRHVADYDVFPEPCMNEGMNRLNAILAVLSAVTPYPFECVDLLRYLASESVQRQFASRGRFVPRKNTATYNKSIGGHSMQSIETIFRRGKVFQTENINNIGFHRNVLYAEMKKWRRGEIGAEKFVSLSREKALFFYRSMEARQKRRSVVNSDSRNKKNEHAPAASWIPGTDGDSRWDRQEVHAY
ncbi:MAG: GntR family transcriptional regulator [Candidatus Pacebacteria bacterium]|nr:GntR family transcriptional regulator [Candidatus Paceibacterota bacterium]